MLRQLQNLKIRIEKIYDTFNNIRSGEFSQAEIEAAVRQMKNGKAPGLYGVPTEFWKLPKVKKSLLSFCNKTYSRNRRDSQELHQYQRKAI